MGEIYISEMGGLPVYAVNRLTKKQKILMAQLAGAWRQHKQAPRFFTMKAALDAAEGIVIRYARESNLENQPFRDSAATLFRMGGVVRYMFAAVEERQMQARFIDGWIW